MSTGTGEQESEVDWRTGTAPAGEPPRPRGLELLRALRSFARDPAECLLELARTYGDICLVRLGPKRIYVLNHPELVREVLVTQERRFGKGQLLRLTRRLFGQGLLTSEGELHRRQRRLMQPAFRGDRLAGYGTAMVAQAVRHAERWRDGQTLDVAREMMEVTLAIVGKTLFDTDVTGEAQTVREILTWSQKSFNIARLLSASAVRRVSPALARRMRAPLDRLDAIIYRFIAEHLASGDRGDLLSMLLEARDGEGQGADAGGMSEQQVRDEALTLFLAGHETTSSTLTWTWYLLSQNPEVEARMLEELDGVLEGRLPGVEDLGRLEYTHMVISEVMRLIPPVWMIGRQALEPGVLGGYLIPQGATVLVSQWAMHRDPRYYPEPLRFDPLRFSDAARAARPRYAYFPFGAGSRACIGDRFSLLEAQLVMATLLPRWQMRLEPGFTLAYTRRMITQPRDGLPMTLSRRRRS